MYICICMCMHTKYNINVLFSTDSWIQDALNILRAPVQVKDRVKCGQMRFLESVPSPWRAVLVNVTPLKFCRSFNHEIWEAIIFYSPVEAPVLP